MRESIFALSRRPSRSHDRRVLSALRRCVGVGLAACWVLLAAGPLSAQVSAQAANRGPLPDRQAADNRPSNSKSAPTYEVPDDSADDSVDLAAAYQQPGAAGRQPGQQPGTGPRAPQAPSSNASQRIASRSDFSLGSEQRSLGRAQAPLAESPPMIGDFLSGGGVIIIKDANAKGPLIASVPGAGGGIRQVKLSEDNSPFPRDRVFFDYNHFHNALQLTTPNVHDINVDRYTPGFEKTFLDGMGSVEMRFPLATTQNPDIFLAGDSPDRDTIFGNMSAALKVLLFHNDAVGVAAGLGVNLPTARETEVFLAPKQHLLTIHNESVHFLPYVAFLVSPNDIVFTQCFVQLDVDANGNSVTADQRGRLGVLNDRTLLYLDIATGFWAYRNPDATYLTGVVPTLEFHYTTSLQDADRLDATVPAQGASFTLGSVTNRFDAANVTIGTHFLLGAKSRLTIAGVLPLSREETERQFDAEVSVQFNRYF